MLIPTTSAANLPTWVNYIIVFFISGGALILFKIWINEVKNGQKDLSNQFLSMEKDLLNNYTKSKSFTDEKNKTSDSRKELWKEMRLMQKEIALQMNQLTTDLKMGFQNIKNKLDNHIENEKGK